MKGNYYSGDNKAYNSRKTIHKRVNKHYGILFLIAVLVLIFKFINNGKRYYEDSLYDISVEDTIRDIDELDSETKEKCEEFVSLCEQEGLNVLITETYRTQARQDYLYSLGRDIEGDIVTWTRKSKHLERRAFDIAKNIPGEEYSDEKFFKRCAEIGQGIGLNAGYFWDANQDKAHFQLD
ncbi:MAG: M15 family metallopeptidase [Tissierellia bacterium]|nr:M15 family metallopeptidase [Tissierellia bacterium]